eukprot:CAMPEP_0202406084 /NCGR_PEP_ID=MMETSP1128-20130828/8159_1 /ASSEMBLY_ACC=CAM_ASM_000463 /TAXON_ID=3047 /ORGANISM="Dunaliella tertiolecta, Strain CCMP1320" /LENGTH=48 /DNA_ID= /DNA_START= /DNA_END= /DNA_ORIENTATION=
MMVAEVKYCRVTSPRNQLQRPPSSSTATSFTILQGPQLKVPSVPLFQV